MLEALLEDAFVAFIIPLTMLIVIYVAQDLVERLKARRKEDKRRD